MIVLGLPIKSIILFYQSIQITMMVHYNVLNKKKNLQFYFNFFFVYFKLVALFSSLKACFILNYGYDSNIINLIPSIFCFYREDQIQNLIIKI
jgi:hypothetical protein